MVTAFHGANLDAEVRERGSRELDTRPVRMPVLVCMWIRSGGSACGTKADHESEHRAADGSNQEIKVRLSDLMDDGDMKQNLAIQAGDVLIIPESLF